MFRRKVRTEDYLFSRINIIDKGFGRSPRYRIELVDSATNTWLHTNDLYGRDYFENAINQFRNMALIYKQATPEQREAMKGIFAKHTS